MAHSISGIIMINAKWFKLFSLLTFLATLSIVTSDYPATSAEVEGTLMEQSDPSILKDKQEIEELKGKSDESEYSLMRRSCNNVAKEGRIFKAKPNSSRICQVLYKNHINAIKRAPFCKNSPIKLPPEIDSDDAKQIEALLKKRCDDAKNEPSE
jgi:predicted Zn-ribbon and HTH transcriptional regulator